MIRWPASFPTLNFIHSQPLQLFHPCSLNAQSFVRLYGSTLGTTDGACETVNLNDYTFYPICGGNASAAFVRWDEGIPATLQYFTSLHFSCIATCLSFSCLRASQFFSFFVPSRSNPRTMLSNLIARRTARAENANDGRVGPELDVRSVEPRRYAELSLDAE